MSTIEDGVLASLPDGADEAAQLLGDAWQDTVRRRMVEALTALEGAIDDPERLVPASGTLLHPALALATAALSGRRQTDAAVAAAAAVELLRRAAIEGPGAAAATGDLLVTAAGTAAASITPVAVDIVMSTFADLCAGQAMEDEHRFDATTSVADALAIARSRSGSLLRAACLLGACAAGLPLELHDALAEYGMSFGVSLQIVDDVLDLVSTAELLGKPVGCAFPAGVMTLPVSMAVQDDPELAALLRPGLGDDERSRAAALLRGSDAIAWALAEAAEDVDVARAAIGSVELAVDERAWTMLARWPRRHLHSLLPKVAPESRHLVTFLDEWDG